MTKKLRKNQILVYFITEDRDIERELMEVPPDYEKIPCNNCNSQKWMVAYIDESIDVIVNCNKCKENKGILAQ